MFLNFFKLMFPSFLFENLIISYIINYLGVDLNDMDRKIDKNLDYDI
nr:MAG TPA: hypothetical protein [Caudoviricetes sp.]